MDDLDSDPQPVAPVVVRSQLVAAWAWEVAATADAMASPVVVEATTTTLVIWVFNFGSSRGE